MIAAFVHGHSSGPGKTGTFSVSLTKEDETFEKTYTIDESTMNYAELCATQFALASVNDRSNSIELHTTNHYLAGILDRDEKGVWTKNTRVNVDLIDNIRNLIQEFKLVRIVVDKDSEEMKKLVSRTKN